MEDKLFKMLEDEAAERELSEKKLRAICEKSERLNYDALINKLVEITENKLPVTYFKFTSFITWLVEDIEGAMICNSECWDMTIQQIDEYLQGHPEYQEHDWFLYENSIDTVFEGLKKEYLKRKEQGLIY